MNPPQNPQQDPTNSVRTQSFLDAQREYRRQQEALNEQLQQILRQQQAASSPQPQQQQHQQQQQQQPQLEQPQHQQPPQHPGPPQQQQQQQQLQQYQPQPQQNYQQSPSHGQQHPLHQEPPPHPAPIPPATASPQPPPQLQQSPQPQFQQQQQQPASSGAPDARDVEIANLLAMVAKRENANKKTEQWFASKIRALRKESDEKEKELAAARSQVTQAPPPGSPQAAAAAHRENLMKQLELSRRHKAEAEAEAAAAREACARLNQESLEAVQQSALLRDELSRAQDDLLAARAGLPVAVSGSGIDIAAELDAAGNVIVDLQAEVRRLQETVKAVRTDNGSPHQSPMHQANDVQQQYLPPQPAPMLPPRAPVANYVQPYGGSQPANHNPYLQPHQQQLPTPSQQLSASQGALVPVSSSRRRPSRDVLLDGSSNSHDVSRYALASDGTLKPLPSSGQSSRSHSVSNSFRGNLHNALQSAAAPPRIVGQTSAPGGLNGGGFVSHYNPSTTSAPYQQHTGLAAAVPRSTEFDGGIDVALGEPNPPFGQVLGSRPLQPSDYANAVRHASANGPHLDEQQHPREAQAAVQAHARNGPQGAPEEGGTLAGITSLLNTVSKTIEKTIDNISPRGVRPTQPYDTAQTSSHQYPQGNGFGNVARDNVGGPTSFVV